MGSLTTSRSTSLGKTTSAEINRAEGISFLSLEIIIFKGKFSPDPSGEAEMSAPLF